ncbi:hypothetical protein, partial [Klebsiella quasipneumoniae]
VFDAQLDKAFAIADTDHVLTYGTTIKQAKVTGSRTGSATCLTVSTYCAAIGGPSTFPSDKVVPASDFPDPTINTYA